MLCLKSYIYTDLKVFWACAHPEGAAKPNYFDRYIPTEVFGHKPKALRCRDI